MEPHVFGVDLWWIPLGAGGRFVKFNGRVYERLRAIRERRRPLDLYHSALEVHVPEGRFVIENAWPVPVADGTQRGVVVEGPVFSPIFARLRSLRYEVRRWPDGIIYDVSWGRGWATPGDRRRCRGTDCWTWCRPFLPMCGVGAFLGPMKCGTRTRSSLGSSPEATSRCKTSDCRQAGAHRVGPQVPG